MQTLQSNQLDKRLIHKGSIWLTFLGMILLGLGILAVCFSFFTTLLSVIALGIVIFAGGVVLVIDSIKYWPTWKPFLLHFLVGCLYLIVGLMLINSPLIGSISLTFLLGVFYLVIGVFRLFYSLLRFTGWNLLSGLISLLLGILILMSWPASSLFIIGLFVGIDLLFAGWTLITLSMFNRAVIKTT